MKMKKLVAIFALIAVLCTFCTVGVMADENDEAVIEEVEEVVDEIVLDGEAEEAPVEAPAAEAAPAFDGVIKIDDLLPYDEDDDDIDLYDTTKHYAAYDWSIEEWEEVVVNYPTCTTPGQFKIKCYSCSEQNGMLVYHYFDSAATGHLWASDVYGTEWYWVAILRFGKTNTEADLPTCTKAGTVQDYCVNCFDRYLAEEITIDQVARGDTLSIDKLPHNYIVPTVTKVNNKRHQLLLTLGYHF